jgi:quercetin dioxygenase-like cupin family protein
MEQPSRDKSLSKEIQVAHWSHPHRPAEDEIVALFQVRGLRPTRWSNGPGEIYGPHTHPYRKTLYCLEGSITFSLPDLRREVELFPGDRLVIPPGARHSATVGPEGVTCIEAGE